MTSTDFFPSAFAVLIGHEGGFSAVRGDPGNWTGGCTGVGALRGTKYGISAASFPTLDIANLTLDQAQAIYRQTYWQPAGCGQLPWALALLVFDAAVNNGMRTAVRLLQTAVGAVPDGLPGTATFAAIASATQRLGVDGICAEFMARRTMLMTGLPTWSEFGLGWARRLCRLPFQAATNPALTAS